MDNVPLSQTLDDEVAADLKRWPLVLVAVLFLAGIAPVFLTRPTAPPPPATSGKSCTSAAAPANASHTESPKTAVDAKGSC